MLTLTTMNENSKSKTLSLTPKGVEFANNTNSLLNAELKAIRRITESVNPAVLVDSGLIVLQFLSAKVLNYPQNLYNMAVFPTIFKYLTVGFPYCDLGEIPHNYRNNPSTFAPSFTSKK